MTDINPNPAPFPSRSGGGGIRRSAGLKLILVCALVLLMAIPAMFIGAISFERSNSAQQVVRDVSQRYGGQQTLIGPVLSVPYSVMDRKTGVLETGHYILYPETGAAIFEAVDVEVKSQSLFKVPVYTASGRLGATFSDPLEKLAKAGVDLDLERAKLIVSVSDVRGLKQDMRLKGPGGVTRLFEPAQFDSNYIGSHKNDIYDLAVETAAEPARVRSPRDRDYKMPQYGRWLSVEAGDWLVEGRDLIVSAEMVLSGAETLSVVPFGKSTQVKMASTWPDPGFQGEFTPLSRDITEAGFTADWNMPYLSRGIPAQGRAHQAMRDLASNQVRVKFVNTDNPYQTVNRALKYSVLFIGMVFLAYFLFEVIVGVPVHPAQYILIGLAQAIFYLLLLAFAERIGFSPAFGIAALLTVLITSAYAGAVFGGRSYILKAGAVFTTVYGLLFVLMKIEDFALMIGALASFVAIAATMYLTRNMDWYGGQRPQSTQ